MPRAKKAGETQGTSKGIEVVQHNHTTNPRVRVWIKANLQPASYNNIEVGAWYEEDLPKGRTPNSHLDKVYSVVLKDLDRNIKKAFAKLGFKFGG